jgi:hypothetical protein
MVLVDQAALAVSGYMYKRGNIWCTYTHIKYESFISHPMILVFIFNPLMFYVHQICSQMHVGGLKWKEMNYRWMRDNKSNVCICAPRCHVHEICYPHKMHYRVSWSWVTSFLKRKERRSNKKRDGDMPTFF